MLPSLTTSDDDDDGDDDDQKPKSISVLREVELVDHVNPLLSLDLGLRFVVLRSRGPLFRGFCSVLLMLFELSSMHC